MQPPARSIPSARAVALLETGTPLLHCREACLAPWRWAAPEAAALDTASRWVDLAVLVEDTDYQDDLSLYYLGRAAEGLNFPGAAASYYRQSTYLSPTTISCRALSRTCNGVDLPRAALLRLAAIEHRLKPPRSPRARAIVPQPLAPQAAPAPAETTPAAPAPPAPAAAAVSPPAPVFAASPAPDVTPPPAPPPPAVALPSAAPPAAAARAPTDYIEPPPAPH